jgi:small subunit ribosomal protein S17
MADDEKTTDETTEGTEAAPSAEAPASPEPDTAAASDSSQGASADDAAPATSDAPAGEERASRPAAEVPAAEPQEQLAPKERRQRARAAKAAKRGDAGPRTLEERLADRDLKRAAAAKERRARRTKVGAKHKAEAHNRTATPAREHVAGQQKVRQGIVTSDKADKTITVRIDVARRHRRYEKIVRTSQTLHAHDEANDAHIGDTVTVRECRPLSRAKRWRLVGVVERAK